MIAIDVMGGDNAPLVVLEGALAAAIKGIPVQLHGPEALITTWLAQHAPAWQNLPISLVPSIDIISMDEEPVFAVRKKPSSSLVAAVASTAKGTTQAALSAGNSGAFMAASALMMGRFDGIERPAIAGYLPTLKGTVLALDLGANTDCRPQHLLQFAHLGHNHATNVMGIVSPRIGLLSNGHEPTKGSQLVKEAHALLKADPTLNFVGNVEPYGIINHDVDVIVCDGFAGNVLLKTMEAISDLIIAWHPALKDDLQQRFANHSLGGALLLGVKGTAIVCHGNADATTLERAITFAWKVSGSNKAV